MKIIILMIFLSSLLTAKIFHTNDGYVYSECTVDEMSKHCRTLLPLADNGSKIAYICMDPDKHSARNGIITTHIFITFAPGGNVDSKYIDLKTDIDVNKNIVKQDYANIYACNGKLLESNHDQRVKEIVKGTMPDKVKQAFIDVANRTSEEDAKSRAKDEVAMKNLRMKFVNTLMQAQQPENNIAESD